MAENNNEVRSPFDEYSFEVLAALNHLITTNEVCKNDKPLQKVAFGFHSHRTKRQFNECLTNKSLQLW